MRSSTTVEAIGSNPAVGSSYMTTSSSVSSSSSPMMALAKATLFFIPPLSWAGYLSSTPLKPTLDKLLATSCFTFSSSNRSCFSRKANPTFSPTFKESNKAALWNTIPMRSCGPFLDKSSSSTSPCLACPRTSTCPSSGASNPARTFNTVDFPVPDGPMMPTASPRRT
mmetsp:Transcript_2172/g.14364  ORF Transcript_2172/g.14364 Transcript_2172/m.14364 type:complete len:168 (-) Transcript_2172:157-660(-)